LLGLAKGGRGGLLGLENSEPGGGLPGENSGLPGASGVPSGGCSGSCSKEARPAAPGKRESVMGKTLKGSASTQT
jgi:hypothetical protein